MAGRATRRLYGQVLLHDKVLQSTLITWLASMSAQDCDHALAEYAALLDDDESRTREVWVARVRSEAAALRLKRTFAFTIH